jgi:adenosine deaminase
VNKTAPRGAPNGATPPASGITEAFVRSLPKTDLHVHLDGSVRIPTLIDLAREYNVKLPSYTEEGLRELVFKERYNNLGEYLHGFAYLCAVLQSEVALERAGYELCIDNQEEGVRYVEARFAPQLHVHGHLNAVMVLKAVSRGMKRAADEFNARPTVVDGTEPPFHFGIIVSAMRKFTAGFSEYFRNLIDAHRYSDAKDVYRMASMELARAAILARDEYGLPVVGFDLAGEEAGYPASEHREAFEFVHKNFMKKTVHAGEAYGPESIFQAVTDLYADRIGHGTYLLDPGAIHDGSGIVDRENYVKRLGEFISDRRITLEICLTSNLQTNPSMHSLQDHSFRKLREARVSTTLCTDNRTVSNTTVTNEYMQAVNHLDLSRKDLKSIVIYGFKRSFFAGTYKQKRAYVRQIIDYYERLEREQFGDIARDSGEA